MSEQQFSNEQLNILNTLTEEERKIVLDVLKEYGELGYSKIFDSIKYKDYNEIPVDILTFLTDDNYLGKPWKDAGGNLKLYPFWLETLQKLFPNNVDTDYTALLESGARGIGKSEVACGCAMAYLMYRVMCLKNPLEFFHLKPTEKIVFAFMNIKLDLAEEIAVSKFQKTVQLSPWFMSRGKMIQRNNQPYWVPPEPISIVIGSQADDVIGKPVFCAFFDEISFIRNQDIDKQKKKAKDMIDTALGGMLTRFVHNGKNPTLLIVASSKRSEQSFMETYIKSMKENEGQSVLVVDEPVWKVKPKGTYSDKTFRVGLGSKFLSSIVIPDGDDIVPYKEKGYKIIDVPIDFKAKFLEDIDRGLCDYAGISSVSSNKYFSPEAVLDCIDEKIENPLPEVLEVGTGKDDTRQYYHFFDVNKVPKKYMNYPLFVHLDMSVTGDTTGIAGVWIVDKKTSTSKEEQDRDLHFRTVFATAIKAPKGRQISFEKNRNFIRWLREKGFNVKEVTSDTYQAYDLQQQLTAEGFKCSILSMDRVDSESHICKPYQYLKSTVYEKRLHMFKSMRLYEEFIDVERNMNTGKIDHPAGGRKDTLDAVGGAVYTASHYAEEFAYTYGEDLGTFVEVNKNKDNRQQMIIDFEEELKKMNNPLGNRMAQTKKDDDDEDTFNSAFWASKGIII